jgi:nucleotide-binding universal stress UspA family protein
MYKKILIPLDNSATDQAILDHIQPLARMTKAELILVHVADGYVARLQDQLNLADSQEIKDDRSYLDKCKAQLAQKHFKVESVLIKGKAPVHGILEVAKAEGCDLIAMATHGHGPVQDLVLGSVADELRHLTDIPILMIRKK